MPPAPSVAVAARLPSSDLDPRVTAANELFVHVVRLLRSNGMAPTIVSDPAVDLTPFAAVVLPGGGDVDPARYGGTRTEAVYDVNPAQEALDFTLARTAVASELPVLGICRGAQVLNVATGGSLVEDLPTSSVQHSHVPLPGEAPDLVRHQVQLAPSRLRRCLGAEVIDVASGHHQGIDRLGKGLRVVARATDGLIEAFEDDLGWLIGVQWHPEAQDTPRSLQEAPFRALAETIAEQRLTPPRARHRRHQATARTTTSATRSAILELPCGIHTT